MSGCEENEWGHQASEKRREERTQRKKELLAYLEVWAEFDLVTRKAVADHMERTYLELRMQSPRPPETDACLIAADILRRMENGL